MNVHHSIQSRPPNTLPSVLIRDVRFFKANRHLEEDIHLVSRASGMVQLSNQGAVLGLPQREYGTVGLISLPTKLPNSMIFWIKIGFNQDFLPVCRMGYGLTQYEDVLYAVTCLAVSGYHKDHDIWNSDWIHESLPRKGEHDRDGPTMAAWHDGTLFMVRRFEQRAVHGQMFGHQRFEVQDVGPAVAEWNTPYLNFNIRLKLRTCPPQFVPRSWRSAAPKIWSFEIYEKHIEHGKGSLMVRTILGELTGLGRLACKVKNSFLQNASTLSETDKYDESRRMKELEKLNKHFKARNELEMLDSKSRSLFLRQQHLNTYRDHSR